MDVRQFKKIVEEEAEFQGTQMMAHVVGVCSCGNGTPILLMLHPGMPSSTKCGKCQTVYELISVSYDKQSPGEVKMKVGRQVPTIVTPPQV